MQAGGRMHSRCIHPALSFHLSITVTFYYSWVTICLCPSFTPPPRSVSLSLSCPSPFLQSISTHQTSELIRALQELENAASGDSVLRQRISSLPAEVQDASLLHRITGRRRSVLARWGYVGFCLCVLAARRPHDGIVTLLWLHWLGAFFADDLSPLNCDLAHLLLGGWIALQQEWDPYWSVILSAAPSPPCLSCRPLR